MSFAYAFETLNRTARSPVVILCDHASRQIPLDISDSDLGLGLTDLERHIAYDVGAYDVARIIAQNFDATMISSRFSRLLIDVNRGEEDPTLIMRLYDGTVIPGNRRAGPAETEQRLARFHRPYHHEIGGILDSKLAAGLAPILISIHSFTRQLRGQSPRPWHIGVLWDVDGRLAQPFIRALAAQPDICVGDNEPYSGRLPGDTLHKHGLGRGLAHLLIEIRNDLIETAQGQNEWAEKIMPALRDAISALREIKG